jgi:hypothetical protein
MVFTPLLLSAVAGATLIAAQSTPLASKRFNYANLVRPSSAPHHPLPDTISFTALPGRHGHRRARHPERLYVCCLNRLLPLLGLTSFSNTPDNRCNSTTEGPTSLCQTAIINGLDDFCLWCVVVPDCRSACPREGPRSTSADPVLLFTPRAPQEPGSVVGDIEGEMVAWCTKAGRGTRQIPAGALQGVQFMKASLSARCTGVNGNELLTAVPPLSLV